MRLRILTWMGAVLSVAAVISIFLVMTSFLQPFSGKEWVITLSGFICLFSVLLWFFKYKSGPFLPDPKKRLNWKWDLRSNPFSQLLLIPILFALQYGARGFVIGIATILLMPIPLGIFHLLTRRIAATLPLGDPRIVQS